jgi:arylsulfatase A-like enzyme
MLTGDDMVHQPNVLLLTVDTLRADMLGSYGHDGNLTPALDRLAHSGLRFSQAITGGSWTQAALPVILTSSHASTYGGCLSALSPDRPSPVETLAAQGYTTAGFSTNPHLSVQTNYDRGFTHFQEFIPDDGDPVLRTVTGGQRLLRTPAFHYLAAPFGKQLRPGRVYSSAGEVTDSTWRWMKGVESPFFAWVHYMDAHWPYHLEESLTRPGELAAAWQDLAIMHRRASFKREKEITPAQRDRFLELYKRALQYLDAQIGRLLEHLEESGLAKETIIVVVSDHGEEFLDHGRWGHWESNLYDEIIRVPLIVRLPHQTARGKIDRQVRTLDLMPTILDLCNCPVPDNVEGTSLVPLWDETAGTYDVADVLCEMHRPPWHRIAVRTERFKFIWDNQEPHPELYDLASDPGETEDVSREYPDLVRKFEARVQAHLQRVAETAPDTTPDALDLDDATRHRLRALGYVD